VVGGMNNLPEQKKDRDHQKDVTNDSQKYKPSPKKKRGNGHRESLSPSSGRDPITNTFGFTAKRALGLKKRIEGEGPPEASGGPECGGNPTRGGCRDESPRATITARGESRKKVMTRKKEKEQQKQVGG